MGLWQFMSLWYSVGQQKCTDLYVHQFGAEWVVNLTHYESSPPTRELVRDKRRFHGKRQWDIGINRDNCDGIIKGVKGRKSCRFGIVIDIGRR